MGKIINKSFFIGFGSGILFVFIVFVIGGAIFYGWMMGYVEENLDKPIIPLQVDYFPDADYNLPLISVDTDEKIRLEDFRGKVIFLNLWATWCAPCQVEMKTIEKLYSRMADNEVQFLIITPEDKDKVKEFKDKIGYKTPFFVFKTDSLPEIYNSFNYPRTYLLTPDGKIGLKHLGAANWIDKELIEFIEKIKEKKTLPTKTQNS